MNNKRIWHYTTGHHIPEILAGKFIDLSVLHIPQNEKPAVWFSANPVYEQTCRKLVELWGAPTLLTKNGTCEICGGLWRIEVAPEAAPYNWPAFKKLSGISNKNIRHMLKFAKTVGAKPDEWYCNFDVVEINQWLSVENWNQEEKLWVPHPELLAEQSEK